MSSNSIPQRVEEEDISSLFETKGTYGYGNVNPMDLMKKPWKPLTRKVKIPAAILSPYRYINLYSFIVKFKFSI